MSAPYNSPDSYDVRRSTLDTSTLYNADCDDGSTVDMKDLNTGYDEVVITLSSTLTKSVYDKEHYKLEPFVVCPPETDRNYQDLGKLPRTVIDGGMAVTDDGSQFVSTITDPSQLGHLSSDIQYEKNKRQPSTGFGSEPWTNGVTDARVWYSPCDRIEIQGGHPKYLDFQSEPGDASLPGLIQRVSVSKPSQNRHTPGLSPDRPVPKPYREPHPPGVVLGEAQDDEIGSALARRALI